MAVEVEVDAIADPHGAVVVRIRTRDGADAGIFQGAHIAAARAVRAAGELSDSLNDLNDQLRKDHSFSLELRVG